MNGEEPKVKDSGKESRSEWIFLLLTVPIFIWLRMIWVGHLLTWDEAATLCSVRSFAAQGTDYYAGWFWRRPPFYNLLLVFLRPLAPGLHLRAQLMTLGIACATAFAMWKLNRTVYGRRIALWSVFLLGVMPGAVFYDTWIKQDVLAAFFGLVAILFFLQGRLLYSGLALGVAFLAKELAIFYAGVVFILWLYDRCKRPFRQLAAVGVVASAAAGWWYLLFSNSVKAVWRFLTDPTNEETKTWFRPWYYFLEKLPVDLEWWGIALALYGCVALWLALRKKTGMNLGADVSWALPDAVSWPLALLVPAYTLITFMKAKTPWFTISLFPAWATLQAVGWVSLLRAMERATWARWISRTLPIILVVATLALRWGRDYEDELRKREWGLWWGSFTSRATAQRLNELVKGEERVLITPMFYWSISKKIPCVVFVYYLRPGIPVVVRNYDLTSDEFVNVVREFKLHWAMVSPEPGQGEKVLIHPLIEKYRLTPRWNRGACIFRTDTLWTDPAGAEQQDDNDTAKWE